MSTPNGPERGRTVAAALAEVGRWRADEEARAKAEMVEVEQEIRNLQTAIQNLQSQLEALHRFSADLETKKKGLAESEMKRAHAEVLVAIQAQSKALGMRDALVGQARSAADTALSERLRSPELSGVVEEYRQFRSSIEPTIAALPDSYRKVILAHHETVTRRLRDIVEAATSQPVTVDAPDLHVEVVWGVDMVESAPELLVCVLPISEQVHAHWSDTVEGVQSWLAARVVQGVYEAANLTGFARVQALTGGHEGLLVVEVDLNGASAAFPEAFGKRLLELLPRAPELVGARVVATAVRVEMDVLLPPQGEEDGDAG
jgi:hypothetical protein